MATALKPDELKVGQRVTVLRWLGQNDRSYVGSVLNVEAVDLPFVVFIETVSRYGFLTHDRPPQPHSLRVTDVEFGTLSDEYVQAMQPRVANRVNELDEVLGGQNEPE